MNEQPFIDEVDAKIMKILLEDVRISFNEIAKKCGMSTNTIRSRYNLLKKEGIVTGEIMQINPKILDYNCVGTLGIKTDFCEEKNFIKHLEKIPGIIRAHRQMGRFNITAFFALKNYSDLDNLIQKLNLNPNIKETDPTIWVDVINMDHPQNLCIESLDNTYCSKKISQNNTQKIDDFRIDEIDLSIINILSENARTSFRQIGTQIGLSTQGVIERYKKLKSNVIEFSSITINLEKIGYSGIAIFIIKISNQHVLSEVYNKILQIPNVIIAYRVMGNFQITVGTPFKNINQLIRIYNKIAKTSGVDEIESIIHESFPSWPLNLFSKLTKTTKK